MKTFNIESLYCGNWCKIVSGVSQSYCHGYLDSIAYDAPRLGYRIIRSDGKIVREIKEREDVSVGMVAGWPTPEQYEFAAEKALKKSKRNPRISRKTRCKN